MLGLREQIHRNPVGIGFAIAHHQNFGRAGNHVNADYAEHHAFGGGDIGVARAGNLVDFGNGASAIGQRRHRLRAADGEHAIHTGNRRRRQHHVVEFTIGRGHDHDQLRHTGDLGGNSIHQHR